MEIASDVLEALPYGRAVSEDAVRTAGALSVFLPVLVDIQPGNMTRYEMFIAPLMGAISDHYGLVERNHWNEHDALVVLTNREGNAAVLPILSRSIDDRIHPSYIADKLSVSFGDAEPLTSFFILVGALTHGN